MKKLLYIWILFLSVFATVTYATGTPKLLLKAHGGAIGLFGTEGQTSNNFINTTVTNIPDSFTLEAWINPKDLNQKFQILAKNSSDGMSNVDAEFLFQVVQTTGALRFIVGDGNSTASYYTSNEAVQVNQWSHVVATYDSTTNTTKLYLNSIELTFTSPTDITTGTRVTSSAPVQIGRLNNSIPQWANGQMDEIRIWNKALTSAEINASMDYQLEGNESGLLAYYNFDERIGDNIVDIAGGDNNATMEGNVTRLNFLGDELRFNGIDDNISFDTNTSLNSITDEISFAGWVKLEDNETIHNAFLVFGESVNAGVDTIESYSFEHRSNVGLRLRLQSAHNTTLVDIYNATNPVFLDANRSYYVAFTWSSQAQVGKIYVDGELKYSQSTVSGTVGYSANPALTIGAWYASERYTKGNMSQLSLWNKALTKNDINKAMHSSLRGDETGLVGYWPLNEGLGTTAYDKSPNANNGLITGAIWTDTAPKIYGDKLYTTSGLTTFNKLILENNTTAPTFSWNGGVPTSVDFNGTTGVFTHTATDQNESFSIAGNNAGSEYNLTVRTINYPAVFTSLNLTLLDVNLTEYNITNIQVIGADGNSETLFVPGSESLMTGENNISAPIYNLDQNFSIRVDTNDTMGNISWWYNFSDGKLHQLNDGSDAFKTLISASINTFTFDLLNTNFITEYGKQLVYISGQDDANETISIGFNFEYFGTVDSNLTISSNGYMKLGNAIANTCCHYWHWNIDGDNLPIIAPFWTNLNPSLGGDIYYKLEGTSPNQVLTISYINVVHAAENNSPSTFHVKLYQTTNNIEFDYGTLQYTEVLNDGQTQDTALVGLFNDKNITYSLGEGNTFDEGSLDNSTINFKYNSTSKNYMMDVNASTITQSICENFVSAWNTSSSTCRIFSHDLSKYSIKIGGTEEELNYALNLTDAGDTIIITSPGTMNITSAIGIFLDTTIQTVGSGSFIFDGNSTNQLFAISPDLNVRLIGLTFQNSGSGQINGAVGNDGNLTIESCVFQNNNGNTGGAIYNSTTGNLIVNNSVFKNNIAAANGGAIYNDGALSIDKSVFNNNQSDYSNGGAIFNNSTASLKISNSTLYENNSTLNYGGGAIYSSGLLNILNSTISGNGAPDGGGIYADSGDINISHSTIAYNVSGFFNGASGGGIYNFSASSININNSIIINNTDLIDHAPNIYGNINSYGNNIIGLIDGNLNKADISGTNDINDTNVSVAVIDALDTSLQIPVHNLVTNSIALDRSSCLDLSDNNVSLDQLGTSRPQGAGCDIGAVEFYTQLPVSIEAGYTYISLPNSKALCDKDLQTSLSICNQNETLESVFGSNTNIVTVFKYAGEWQYWDNAPDINASLFMNKFSIISPLDGVLVHATAATTINLPLDGSDAVNTYANMPVEKWILLSNKKDQTIAEITASIPLDRTLLYIQLLRNGVWHIYAPTNDSAVDSSIPRLSNIYKYESFWIYFKVR